MSASRFFQALSGITVVVLAAGAFAAGCQPGTQASIQETVMAAAVATLTAMPSQTPAQIAASATGLLADAQPTEAATPRPISTGAASGGESNLLRFVFPTPGSHPSSAWRPPLYPAPWAPGPYDHFYFTRPIAADEVNWPVADYRYGGVFPDTDIIHSGIDIDAPLGTPVIAAAPGRVIWAGYGLFRGVYDTQDPYGMAVAIRHEFGYQGKHLFTVYAHMKQIDVIVGQEVNTGDPIGLVGNTGRTTGPHLHFEVRVENNDFFKTRNPELWLVPPQGWGVLVGRLTHPNGTLLERKEVLVRSADLTNFWLVRSYGPQVVVNDPYYQENLVLSDLPGGDYTIWVESGGIYYNQDVHISGGQVTYFTFNGKDLFHLATPSAPDANPFKTPKP